MIITIVKCTDRWTLVSVGGSYVSSVNTMQDVWTQFLKDRGWGPEFTLEEAIDQHIAVLYQIDLIPGAGAINTDVIIDPREHPGPALKPPKAKT